MKRQFFFYLAVGLLLDGYLAIFKPFAVIEEGGLLVPFLFIIPIFVTQAGAVWYFLTSLKSFQPRLRLAYAFLVAGLLLFTLAQMQLPLTVLFSVFAPDTDPTLIQVLLLVPYGLGTLVMYVGTYLFARLLQIRFLWTKLWFAAAFALGVVALVCVVPHPTVEGLPEDQWDLLFGLVAWSAAFSIAAAVVAWRIQKQIGASYKPAAAWLAIALTVLSAAYSHTIILQTVGSLVPAFEWYTQQSLELILYLAASIAFLRAGQLYRLVGKQYVPLPQDATQLDVVISTAQLASSYNMVQETMEPIRELTASKAQLTGGNEAVLKTVYLQLEDYLINREPLRRFSKDGLRSRLPEKFRQSLEQL